MRGLSIILLVLVLGCAVETQSLDNLEATINALSKDTVPTASPISMEELITTISAGVIATVEARATPVPTPIPPATPVPTSIPSPTASPSPAPTATPTPVPTPTATLVPTPTAIPVPSYIPTLFDYKTGLGELLNGFTSDSWIALFDDVTLIYLIDSAHANETLSAASFITYTGAHVREFDTVAIGQYRTMIGAVNSPPAWMQSFYAPSSGLESESACRLVLAAQKTKVSPFVWDYLSTIEDCVRYWADYQVSDRSYAAGYIEYLGVKFELD
jgi:hypothetical protein